MTHLIIGTGGMIGDAVARHLAGVGETVVGVSRSGGADEDGILRVAADRRDIPAITDLIEKHRIETVIDVIAYTLADTAPLLAALDGRVARYVLISSSDVYRNYGLLHRRETGAPDPGDLTEDAPLRTSRHPYRQDTPRSGGAEDAWLDAYDKIPIEEAARAMAAGWTILRLPMVYGPGDRQRRFGWALGPMLKKAPVLPVPPAWGAWITTYGFIGNVAAAIAHAARHPAAARRTFNVTDTAPMDHWTWIERLRGSTGWTGAVTASDDHPIAAAIAALNLDAPLRLSGARLHTDLAFTPPVGLDEALAQTIADEARQPAA